MPADTTSAMPLGTASPSPLRVHWSRHQAIVNFRGDPSDSGLMQALSARDAEAARQTMQLHFRSGLEAAAG